MTSPYDALLLVSFGGPESREDVLPFLENVLRGRNVPRERMLQVAEHYYHFGGRSPINGNNRALIAAIEAELAAKGPRLPVYWGNRNWHPFLADTLRRMQADGIRHALGLVTSAFSSYSGCRQYLDDIIRAQAAVGPDAPRVDKLRSFYNHPGFLDAVADRTATALAEVPANRRAAAHLLFTAHSIPLSMAQTSPYVEQLNEACALVAGQLHRQSWRLVYQSRSGAPGQPWLEPDIGDALSELPPGADAVVVPIGFLSDHMEVVYDLDTEARAVAVSHGVNMIRAATVGTHPRFIAMIRELIEERIHNTERCALGQHGPRPDQCAEDCCPPAARPRPASH
ncbi:MAG: ferrochelatase [bacterium]